MIYNNTPGAKNMFGGNIVAQPIDVFMKDRTFIKTIPTDNCPAIVREYSYENRFKKWNALFYNCEDYVNEITYCQKKSHLRTTVGIASLVGLYLYLRN